MTAKSSVLDLFLFPEHEASRSIATPPGWGDSPSRVVTPTILLSFLAKSLLVPVNFILLGEESYYSSCPRTQHSDPGSGPSPLSGVSHFADYHLKNYVVRLVIHVLCSDMLSWLSQNNSCNCIF